MGRGEERIRGVLALHFPGQQFQDARRDGHRPALMGLGSADSDPPLRRRGLVRGEIAQRLIKVAPQAAAPDDSTETSGAAIR